MNQSSTLKCNLNWIQILIKTHQVFQLILSKIGSTMHPFICPFEGGIPICCKSLYLQKVQEEEKKKLCIFMDFVIYSQKRIFLTNTFYRDNLYFLFSKIFQKQMVTQIRSILLSCCPCQVKAECFLCLLFTGLEGKKLSLGQ